MADLLSYPAGHCHQCHTAGTWLQSEKSKQEMRDKKAHSLNIREFINTHVEKATWAQNNSMSFLNTQNVDVIKV